MTDATPFRFVGGLIAFALILFGIIIGKAIILPFLVAVVVWFLVYTLAMSFRQIPYIGERLPLWLTILLALVVIFSILGLLVGLVTQNAAALVEEAPKYQARMVQILFKVQKVFHVKQPIGYDKIFKEFNLLQAIAATAQAAAELARSAIIILLYVLFLLMEQHLFVQKMRAMASSARQHEKTLKLVDTISKQIQSYLKIKTLISFATALISYGVLRFVNVDFAEIWAVLIFLLNFIPTIGSIIATLMPILLTLVQFDNLTPFFIVALGLTTVQFIIGNVIEPRLFGRSFNLSPLVILFSLAFWSAVWGIIGMFLCVPIMVIGIIILSHFDSTRPIAVALSENGQLPAE